MKTKKKRKGGRKMKEKYDNLNKEEGIDPDFEGITDMKYF